MVAWRHDVRRIRNPSPRRYLAGYPCECSPGCGEVVYMNTGSFERAHQLGRIVTVDHVNGGLVERHLTYAIVEA